MNTVLEMMAVAGLGVLFALAWHNQPVREPVPARRTAGKPEPHRASSTPAQGGL